MDTKDKNKDISHDGHRDRLAKLVSDAGTTKISKIQIVEWALTLVFPRGDVNPLAHRLLDKYGNFANIVDASIEDLCEVKGINTRSAIKIKSFKQIIFAYNLSKLEKKISLNNRDEFLNYVANLLRFEPTEVLMLFSINAKNEITQYRCYDMESVRATGIPPIQLINFAASTKLSRMISVHNHPGGYAMPSNEDNDANAFVDDILKLLGCSLYDSYIVGDNGIYSSNIQGIVKYFDDDSVYFY